MKKLIYPCLWYDGKAKEAASFYCGIFKNSKITFESPIVVKFNLDGAEYMGLNGGSQFKFNESVSLVVECDDQHEIDYYWDKLIAGGGNESMCGWLKDKYGISWQIVPAIIGELMADPVRGKRVMQAVMKMRKLNIEEMINA
jgi:predicted 3-demethylubiquinone-9 3-methyltransferase (glyoxalase superfamily)